MKETLAVFACLALPLALGASPAAGKPRVFVLTDIENEPDDAMSMVRFLDLREPLRHRGPGRHDLDPPEERDVAPQRIRQIVDAYGKVRDNLEQHEPGFPTGEQLLVASSARACPSTAWKAWARARTPPGSETADPRDRPR